MIIEPPSRVEKLPAVGHRDRAEHFKDEIENISEVSMSIEEVQANDCQKASISFDSNNQQHFAQSTLNQLTLLQQTSYPNHTADMNSRNFSDRI